MVASTASMTAALVPDAGTKITQVSAPVSVTASLTVPKTGTSVPPRSTVWPALRGLVPPTTLVPAASIRAPCLRPSEPGMPWMMIRLSLVRKIAMSCSRRGQAGQLGGPPGVLVHRRHLLDDRNVRLGEDPAALGGVVAVESHYDRAADLLAALAQEADRRDDPVGDRVAGCDPAEYVHEHRADRGVGQHDLQAIRHDLGRRPAADVEEVGRPHAAELLARVGDDVKGRHHQASAIADDADGPFQLDVVEVLLLGPRLDRVGRARVGEPLVVLPE